LNELQSALQSVLEGERWIPALLREPVARVATFSRDADLAARLASLSAHQYKVLGLVAEGLLNKQIADRLGVQLRTVKAHMTRIMERLGVRNRAQAIRVLHEMGLADPSRQIEELPEP
jgi:DNA-binding NarL/FixJ family response regulator